MPQASICRMCLVTDVRMVVIAGTPLQFLYEKITEAELLENMKPVAACYVCHAMLRKCQNFITKSVRADELLTDFLINNKLTVKAVARIDRKAYNLNHSLSTKVECHDNTPSEEDDEPKVKQETTFEFVGDGDHSMDFEEHTEFPLNEPVVEINEKTFVQPEEGYLEIQFKEEKEPIVSDGDDNRDMDSEDEQPLTKVKAGKPGRPPKRKQEDEDWKPAGALKDDGEVKQEPAEKKPKKQGPKGKRGVVPKIQLSEDLIKTKKILSLEYVSINNRRRYRCQFCQKVFANRDHMRAHLRMHTGEKPYNCIYCAASFGRVYHLKRHIRIHTGEKPHQCEFCIASFSRLYHLKRHMVSHESEAPYGCNVCHRRFKREDNLKTHLKIHNKDKDSTQVKTEFKSIKTETNIALSYNLSQDIKPHVCIECGAAFSQFKQLKKHSLLHTGEPVYECDYCHRTYPKKCYLRVHIQKHLDDKKYECDICRLKFSKQEMLDEHFKVHAVEIKSENASVCKGETEDNEMKKCYQCNDCGARFARNYRLKRHLLMHTGDASYECVFCHCKFNQKINLRMHLKKHTGQKTHKCDLCQRRFPDKAKYERHLKKHVDGKPLSIYDLKPFLCNQCGTRFSRRYHLNRHLATHSGQPIHKCDFCPYVFNIRNDLRLHLKTHAMEKKYPCEVCDRRFRAKKTLEKHVLAKHNDDPNVEKKEKVKKAPKTDTEAVVCNVCGIVLNRKYDLKRHLLQHSGERPFECNICHKSFTQNSSLTIHMRRHTGYKPFECTICHYKFYEKSNLTIHMTKHSDEKPHECDVCNRKFKRKDVLTMHQKIHSGEKPHECYICLRRFALKKTMKKHLNTHKIEKVENTFV